MSILTERLPNTIEIEGKTYAIQTNFRIWIKFSQTAFSKEFNAVSLTELLVLVFSEELPTNVQAAISGMLDFYSLQKNHKGSEGKAKGERFFDFDYDAEYIYAAFMQQYNIDLTKEELHWWTFKALLDSLSDETHFGKIMQYRCTDLSKIKDKEMKKFYEKMKRTYAIPDNRTEEEKERDFAEGLWDAF